MTVIIEFAETFSKVNCSVRTKDNGHGGHHLQSWVIEASNDGVSWTVIDCRDDTTDLNGKYRKAIFHLPDIPKEGYRFFRL